MKFSPWFQIRYFFAKDKYLFVWNEITDEAKELQELSTWQLAELINECERSSNDATRRTYAEHLLAHRLSQHQAKASWGAGLFGFFGAILGAIISITLAPSIHGNGQIQYVQPCPQTTTEKQNINHKEQAEKQKTITTSTIVQNKPLQAVDAVIPAIKQKGS
jgi:hypothetical protein